MKSLIAITTMILTAMLASSAPAIPRDDYAAAYRSAQASGRPLLVLVGAEWCEPCREVRKFEPTLRKLGHYARVDVERERPLATRLIGARPLPCLIVYRWQQATREWRVERRLVGANLIVASIVRDAEERKLKIEIQRAEVNGEP